MNIKASVVVGCLGNIQGSFEIYDHILKWNMLTQLCVFFQTRFSCLNTGMKKAGNRVNYIGYFRRQV